MKNGTRVDDVMLAVRRLIAERTLMPGAKLPSIRSFAETMAVSNSTVVDAYDRLVANGVIRSRRGSGFYVAGHPKPLSLTETGPRLDRVVDPLWVSRQALEAGDRFLKPGCGWLPPSWFPEGNLRSALRHLSRDATSAGLTDYASPIGSPLLRNVLAQRLAERGIEAEPHQIVLTDGATQSVDLLCRFLLQPGDTVLVDDPCYFNFLALLRAQRVQVVGVPRTQGGPDLEALASAMAAYQPRLYVTNSVLHNPTGSSLSPVIAHKVLKLAEQWDLTIIEDDVYADLEHEPGTRLAAFDGLSRVIHVGSFSKTLTAAARCGYIAVRSDWVEALLDLKVAVTFGASQLAAELILTLLTDGSYHRHIYSLRERLARAMSQTTTKLQSIGFEPYLQPDGGMFLWCRLPHGIDAIDLARKALIENVVLAPGNVFSTSSTASSFMRFNVAQSRDPQLFEVLARLLAEYH